MRARKHNNIPYGKPIFQAQEFKLVPLTQKDKENDPSLANDTHILKVLIEVAEDEHLEFIWVAAFPDKFQELATQIENLISQTQNEHPQPDSSQS